MNWIKKIFDRIGAPVAASISADIATVKAKSDYLQDMEDGVYFDSVTGGAGTDWPVGTAQSPSNVIASVITMCTARKTKKIYVNGAVTLGATMEGYTFIGVNQSATITLNSQDVDTSQFYNCTVTGVQGGTGKIYLHNCIISALSECDIDTFNCGFKSGAATISPRSSTQCNIVNGDNYDGVLLGQSSVIDLTDNTTCKVYGYGLTGYWTVKNSVNANNSVILYGRCRAMLISDASNTQGVVSFYGEAIGSLGAGGATETDETLYTLIGNPAGASVSVDIASIKSDTGSISTLSAKTIAGKPQVKHATVDLHNGAGTYDVATCATQDVIIDSLIFTPHDDLSDDAGFTGISIQDNETTPNVYISSANGVKANLTAYANMTYCQVPVKLRVGKKIQITIIGGTATADPSTCDVEITYHAIADGGTL